MRYQYFFFIANLLYPFPSYFTFQNNSMQRILTLALSALIISVTIASCSKAGPAGATGSAGTTGPAGPAGPTGPAGNANIIYSAWDSGFSGLYAYWQVPAITPGVIDSAVVLVYLRAVGSQVLPLPWNNAVGQPGNFINYELEYGNILLYCDGVALDPYAFRYVIIPPGVAGTGMPRSYEEMTAWLGIAP
jgi:hypothetical protein